jgi:hypothetical protein
MEKYIVLGQCRPHCPMFWEGQDGMECMHPQWDGMDFSARMIITMENSSGRVPLECPLRNSPLVVRTLLSPECANNSKI